MRMSIIKYFQKTGRLYLYLIGLFAAFFLAMLVYAQSGYTPVGYVWMVTVFCGAALLLLFPWGYRETDAFALGWYTGMVIVYTLTACGLCLYGWCYVSMLCGVTSGVIGLLILTFLVVPLVKFWLEHKEKNA